MRSSTKYKQYRQLQHLDLEQLFNFLESKYHYYNRSSFIELDPISVPHNFTIKEDIEIAAFLTAIISWGNRKSIIQNALKLMEIMDNSPFDFMVNASDADIAPFKNFVYRTFQGTDCHYFIKSIQNIYKNHNGLEVSISGFINRERSIQKGLSQFKGFFFSQSHQIRSEKHLPDPIKNSAAKRMNMFLRWMVRSDSSGIDFGLWKTLKPAMLKCPLDVHTGNVSRALGLLQRKPNDWKSVEELTYNLALLDPDDPVKYDIALFSLGIHENF